MNNESEIQVLVVDDHITLRHTLVLALDRLGVKADSAANGIEALRRVHSHQYGVIFMDIQMPEMNGLEAAVAIRAFEQSNQKEPVPIIGMTAGSPGVDASKCGEYGMNDFVEKPLLIEKIQELISKWLPAERKAEN